MDQIDLAILEHLQADARISNVDLARRVGLSPSPCVRRVAALEKQGIIRRYVSLIDPAAVGLPISVFVQVSLAHQVETALQEFEAAVSSYPEVMECYLMTGDADYMLRVVVPDLETYQQFLLQRLTRVPGVDSIKSSFALNEVVHRTNLPLNARPSRSSAPRSAP